MKNITVYTTTTCPFCVMVKNFLSEQNIPFTEINVEQNPEYMKKVVEATGQFGVPQTEINGKWIVGFDPNGIMQALQN
ncbi:glutaredoxin family protein [Pueribacillus sp. YX66]|uniref:glutaredoxin family protein n=1 Tax=Pueribacillus sp. YX66 TaxID=3229242 RepID=UPI00358CE094